MSNRRTNARPESLGGRTEGNANRADIRRAAYAQNSDVREEAKRASRDRYREQNPLPSPKLTHGLLTAGTVREVKYNGEGVVHRLPTFTIPEVAPALGRSVGNLRRWINNGLIPQPLLRETVKQCFCYCTDELQLIATILGRHERNFVYFCAKHEVAINEIAQAIHGYRDMTFGESNAHADSQDTIPRRAARRRTR